MWNSLKRHPMNMYVCKEKEKNLCLYRPIHKRSRNNKIFTKTIYNSFEKFQPHENRNSQLVRVVIVIKADFFVSFHIIFFSVRSVS